MERPVFSRQFYRELASENPLGLLLTWQEAEAWFHFIAWPAYKTYHYSLHKKAVRRWWSRLSMRDLERAREAVENVNLERAQQEQDLIEGVEEFFPGNETVLRKILGGKSG